MFTVIISIFVFLSACSSLAGEEEPSRRIPISAMPWVDHHRSYCTYILGSLSGTLYIGVTGNLHKRVFEHKFNKIEGFTKRYEVHRLLYWESFRDVLNAIDREKQLKGWRRSKKIVLIESTNPHCVDLSEEWYPWMTLSGGNRGASTI